MIRFTIFGFPVGVHWFFWILALFVSGAFYATTPEDWQRVMVAVPVIFLSILVHELGHAFAGRHYGARPSIFLHGIGGLASLPGMRVTRGQSILVSAAGPAAGFSLGLFAVALLILLPAGVLPDLVGYALLFTALVNFFWTFVNLFPIMPMDGGQILREILGPSKVRLTHQIGFATGLIMALLALMVGMWILAILLGFLAYANLQGMRLQGGVER